MSNNALGSKITELTHKGIDSRQKIQVGKSRKLVWCSEPYQPVHDYQTGLVGREKEMRLIVAAWIGGQSSAPLTPLLIGEPGVGKNRLIYELALKSRRELYIMQGHEDVTAEDMACGVRFSDEGNNNMDYLVSPLASAMLRGGICFIDEIGKIRPRALALLASVLDDRRYIDSILLGERIHAASGFRFIAATNTGELNMMPAFVRSRLWPVISVGFPQRDELQAIIGHQFPEMQLQLEGLLDTFWALWEKRCDAGKNPTPRDAIHLFALASSLSDLERGGEGDIHKKRDDILMKNRPAMPLNLRPKHLEYAFEYITNEGKS